MDDEPLILAAIVRSLPGHDVVCLRDGCAAIAHLMGDPRPRYDVIMCDLLMPDCSGVDVHRVLSRDRPDMVRKMIFFTGVTQMPAVEYFLKVSGRPVLKKPFGPAELQAAVMGIDRIGL